MKVNIKGLNFDTDAMALSGLIFGYPDCCITHFCDALESGLLPGQIAKPGPWDGTGFLPCPKCQAKCETRDDVKALIKTRYLSTPFPAVKDREFDALFNRMAKAVRERS